MADFFNLETLRFSFGFRFVLVPLFALATTAQSQHFQPVSVDSPQTTIKFSSHRFTTSILFKLVDGRIFVNVSLEREGPFAFIFDTGGNAVIRNPARLDWGELTC
jgi:hypothetical protein